MQIDEHLERLMVRGLDGELDDADRAELDAALAGSPAARTLMDEYRRADRLAAEALHRVVAAAPDAPMALPRTRPWWLRRRVPLAAAVAICVAGGLIARHAMRQPTGAHVRATDPVAARPPAAVAALTGTAELTDRVRVGRRTVDRDLLGIYDEANDTFYMLERRRSRSTVVRVSGEL